MRNRFLLGIPSLIVLTTLCGCSHSVEPPTAWRLTDGYLQYSLKGVQVTLPDSVFGGDPGSIFLSGLYIAWDRYLQLNSNEFSLSCINANIGHVPIGQDQNSSASLTFNGDELWRLDSLLPGDLYLSEIDTTRRRVSGTFALHMHIVSPPAIDSQLVVGSFYHFPIRVAN